MPLGNILLECYVIWSLKCWSNISMSNDHHLPWFYAHPNGRLCWWLTLKIPQKKRPFGHLGQIFNRMEGYKLCLNPKKCVFGVVSGNLLGYIISQRGIEVDPEKVKLILDTPPPKNLKTLRGLQGRLQSIRRFIAQLADKCHSFQSLLRKGISFQ